jgi:hypothetical protein
MRIEDQLQSADQPPLDLRALGNAFDAACDELGIGNRPDGHLRERLIACILKVARQGETDARALQRRALLYFQNREEGDAG